MDWELIGMTIGLGLFSGFTTIAVLSRPSPLEFIFATLFVVACIATLLMLVSLDVLSGDVPRDPAEINVWIQRTDSLIDAGQACFRIALTSAVLCLWVAAVRIWCLRHVLWSQFRSALASRQAESASNARRFVAPQPFRRDAVSARAPQILGKPLP